MIDSVTRALLLDIADSYERIAKAYEEQTMLLEQPRDERRLIAQLGDICRDPPRKIIGATVADEVRGTAARRIGVSRAAFVSPTYMVRGTSMEGRIRTGDIDNICGDRFGGLFIL